MNLIPDVKIQMELRKKKKKPGLLDEVANTLKALSQENLESIGFSYFDEVAFVRIYYKNEKQSIYTNFTGQTYEKALQGIILAIANSNNGLITINSIMKQAKHLSK
jgi:hypothetical protein